MRSLSLYLTRLFSQSDCIISAFDKNTNKMALSKKKSDKKEDRSFVPVCDTRSILSDDSSNLNVILDDN